MKVSPEFVAVLQIGLLSYALFAVRHRNDRRKVPRDMMHALYSVAAFGTGVLVLSVVLDWFAGSRVFAGIREVYQVGSLAVAGAVVTALRILKGAPYDREKGART